MEDLVSSEEEHVRQMSLEGEDDEDQGADEGQGVVDGEKQCEEDQRVDE